MTIRVIVVDDSALVRSVLSEIINSEKDMQVVGTAADPYIARELIRELNPDVITLDIEMPRMDGLDFLEKLMRLRPMPVVMVSTLTERGADATMKALELGAVDFVPKPRLGVKTGLDDVAREIIFKIRAATQAKVVRRVAVPVAQRSTAVVEKVVRSGTEKLIAIGASTGGTEAIRELLMALPPDSPGIVITQHMPPGFTASFATRLNSLCQVRVKEAEDGERILQGHAYVAPGGRQMRVVRSGANYVAEVRDGEPVNRHKPSVEVLFSSVAREVGPNALGVMLTGMGADGATGMRAMRDAGAYNYVQNEESCVVFGMPREAIAAGAANEVLPLSKIAPMLLQRLGSLTCAHRV
ncbi:MAG: chemotaxis response regulator protein-glutamate methylesterase [Pseudomonadota bacterium]